MDAARKLTRRDGLVIAALLALTALYAAVAILWSLHPFEDAAILMRYSQHVAEGHGIVWNIGEKPVDGATDFLFMVLVAGIARCGPTVEGAVRLVGMVSHFAAIVLVYVGIRRLYGSSQWLAGLAAAYLAVGPGLRYVAAYFGTPFFALLVCGTWYLAILLVRCPSHGKAPVLFALTGLTMGLVRPEGVFLAVFMLAAIVYMNGLRASRRIILWFAGVFLIAGGAYFLWRWGYFGYPLPNPFYKKGGGALHWDALAVALKTTVKTCLPLGLALIAGFRSPRTARQAVFSLIPTVGFVALWVLLSNEGNYFGRFQYAILPVVVMSWPPLLDGILADWRLPRLGDLDVRSRIAACSIVGLVLLSVLAYQHRISRMPITFRDGLYDVAVMLRDYSRKGYTLATTEAGLLPFYSRWRAIDALGLNDQWIAHHGPVTESYLDRYRPEVIMFHAYFSPLVPPSRGDEWEAMALTLKRYAERKGYCYAASFGESPYDTHNYCVRTDLPDSEEIIRRIRSMDYSWMSSGRKCVNYAVVGRAGSP